VWQEGNRDGFDDERLFDALFVSSAVGFLTARLFYAFASGATITQAIQHMYMINTPGLSISVAVLATFGTIYLFCNKWHWSHFRVFDIYSLAWAFGLSVVMLGFVALQRRFEFLFAFAVWLLIYTLLVKVRSSRIRSGGVFSIFLLLNVGLGFWFFPGRQYLLFYSLLVTISIVNFYLRHQKSAAGSHMLSQDFIKKVKEKLLRKDKNLADAAKQLSKEDPYMQEGREHDNADLVDDTYEDISHTDIEVKKGAIAESRAQIKRALEKIKEGTYGKDDVTGENISKDRLEAYPEATTTVDTEHDSQQ